MTTLLGTTRQRRFVVFCGGWAYIATAIILRVATNPSGLLAPVTIPGGVYRDTRDVLETFAVEASVEPAVILTIYTVAGFVITTLALYVLDEYAFERQDYIKGLFSQGSGQFTSNILLLYIFIAFFLFTILLLGALLTGQQITVDSFLGPQHRVIPNWGIFTATITFILIVSPQFLALACLGVVLTLFTAVVP